MEKNKIIIDNFKHLINQIKFDFDNTQNRKDKIRHSFRLKQIQNALNIIEKVPNKITSGQQLKHIKGIGPGTIRRIDEILKSGTLNEVKVSGKEIQYLKETKDLCNVFGIGRKKAYELITKYNIHSIDDLRNSEIDLPYNIRIGLKYVDEYQQKIPRKEMMEYDKIINDVIRKMDSNYMVIICGSYRRGKMESNDIDLMISTPKVQKTKDKESSLLITSFHKIIDELISKNIIIDSLTLNFKNKFMGFCRLKNKPLRRIDIRFVPYDSFYTALLYFTGSGEFNRKMRMVASSMGYILNEYGIYDKNNKQIKVNSEEDIFRILNMEYLPPENRND